MSTDPTDAVVWPEGYGLITLEEVGSTNTEAARLAPDLDRPTWIHAHRQSAARGRRGRHWQMPEGHFSATLVMRPGGVPGWAALRSFMAANALFETLALHIDRTRLAKKWPNDVLLDQGKVAGILLDSAGQGGRVDWLAIGFGVNLTDAPEVRDAAFPPVGLAAQGGRAVTPERFLTELAGHYATEESILEQLGFEPIREKWLQDAARLGETITARTTQGDITGVFRSIDGQGHLLLDTPEGRKTIPAADVYF